METIKQMKYTVIVEKGNESDYVVYAPALNGCVSQGETYEEALENIKDAIKLHIEARQALREPVPIEVG